MPKQSHRRLFAAFHVALLIAGLAFAGLSAAADGDRIQPYSENPYYWQYQGQPILLLGGSEVENPFQWTGTEFTHMLDQLKAVGGNYLRNTVSTKYPQDLYPFARLDDGRYDLRRWNDRYWDRLDRFLRETQKRSIIVQIELWDAFRFIEEDWQASPWHPRNNVNYTLESSGLPESWEPYPHEETHPFMLTVPELANRDGGRVVLPYQERFVKQIMEVSLRYDHVLYQIQNENAAPHDWSDHWAAFVHNAAEEAERTIEVTDMRESHDLQDADHQYVLRRPRLYSFFEASQNTHQQGQTHYDRLQWIRAQLKDRPRPINNVKIYGAKGGPFGDAEDGIARFWRNLFGGAASMRFHRGGESKGGLGFSTPAKVHIKSARLLSNATKLFTTAPHNDLLSNRSEDGVYLLAEPGRQYALFFTGRGKETVQLDVSDTDGPLRARWLNVLCSQWEKRETLRGSGGTIEIEAPRQGQWALLITPRDDR